MSNAVYEFPLNEKVRNYLRLENLFKQLQHAKQAEQDLQYIHFFESLFTLLDLLERLDLRNDVLKDVDAHEKNLVHWSQHPDIDTDALQQALQKVIAIRDQLKTSKRLGAELKEDKFLASIRQRFSIPGGTCSFDLPNLHFWLKQPSEKIQQDIQSWLQEVNLVHEAIQITLSFLRERGRFDDINTDNGFHQGVADEKIELIRVYCSTNDGYYPTLSGNKYRFAIRFMWFEPQPQGSAAVEGGVNFKLACC